MDIRPGSAHEDRRIQRTKNLLRDAILALTVERGEFHSIQITEITDRANVARSTFYLHYGEKEELLYDALGKEFHQFMREVQVYYQKEYAPIHVLSLLRYIEDHPRYFKVVLSCVGTEKAFEQTRKTFEDWLINWMDFSVFNHALPPELISYHISSTVLSCIRWWLEKDDGYTPEQMRDYIGQLVFDGLLSILNLETKKELESAFLKQLGKSEKVQASRYSP